MELKKCSKCGEVKSISLFYRQKEHSIDGHKSECKACTKYRTEEYQKNNREKVRLSHRLWREKNRDAYNAHNREYRKEHRRTSEEMRTSRLRNVYGLSASDYDEMKRAQGGNCAICHKDIDETLRVDHDHKTGRVRGLLCHKCNTALGMIDDDLVIAREVVKYLEFYAEVAA